LAAQFDAYLEDELWLTLASKSNDKMVQVKGVIDATDFISVVAGGDANELFVSMKPEVAAFLHEKGHTFFPWPSLPNTYRLVTSFTTDQQEIDALRNDLRGFKG
jgi:threonine aldolase